MDLKVLRGLNIFILEHSSTPLNNKINDKDKKQRRKCPKARRNRGKKFNLWCKKDQRCIFRLAYIDDGDVRECPKSLGICKTYMDIKF